MTNVLHGLAAKISGVPEAYATEAAALVQVHAERYGGKMMGRYQLTSREKKRFVYDQGCTLILEAFPQGFWVWKETGTAAHDIRSKPRRKAKRSGPVKGHGATHGHAPTFTGRKAKKRRKRKPPRMAGRIAIGGGHPITGAVHHPGTSGRRAWTKAIEEVAPKLDAGLALVLAQAVD